jgi:hypothetical protein
LRDAECAPRLGELARPEEEAVRGGSPGVVDGMSVADPAHGRQAEQEADRQAPVHDAVVEEHVRETEERHARARSDRRSGEESVHVASDHDQCGGDGSVRGGERIVLLEAPRAARVMRAMDRVEPVMPHATVEEPRPGLHRGGDHQRDERPEHDGGQRRHDEAS